jgi:hypothetical protein
MEVSVAHHRPGKESGLKEDLKAITNADDQSSALGKLFDLIHDGGEFGDRAGAQIIPVGKPAGKNYAVKPLKSFFFVPDEFRLGSQDVFGNMVAIVIAVRAGEDQDPEFH